MAGDDTRTEPSTERATSCRCCGAPDPGRFCPNCGQGTAHGRLRLKQLIVAAFDHILDLDVPILRTARDLTIRPGTMCRRYIDGQRKPYSNPLKYCFLTAAILLLTFTVFEIRQADAFVEPSPPGPTWAELVADIKRTDDRLSGDEFGQRMKAYFETTGSRFVEDNLSLVAFFTMPFLALALTILFRRQKLTYAEHLVFALFVYGHAMILNSILGIAGLFATIAGFIIVNVIELAYVTWAAVVFYRTGVVTTALRMIVLLVVYLLSSVLLTTLFIIAQVIYLIILIIQNAP